MGYFTEGALTQRYPGLVKELRLIPAGAEAFQDLLAKHDAAFNSMTNEMMANEATRRDPLAQRQMVQDMRKSQAAELEAQLGPERSRAWQEYQTTGDDPRALLEFEERNLQSRVESNRRTVDTARSFMTPEQVSLMQDSMDRFNERTRASLQTRRERLEQSRQP